MPTPPIQYYWIAWDLLRCPLDDRGDLMDQALRDFDHDLLVQAFATWSHALHRITAQGQLPDLESDEDLNDFAEYYEILGDALRSIRVDLNRDYFPWSIDAALTICFAKKALALMPVILASYPSKEVALAMCDCAALMYLGAEEVAPGAAEHMYEGFQAAAERKRLTDPLFEIFGSGNGALDS